jgi:DNA-binding response OmpR family regulator
MTTGNDGGATAPAKEKGECSPQSRQSATAPRLLIVDADPALQDLLEEWLSAQAYSIAREWGEGCRVQGSFDLIIVDVPFPRGGGLDVLKRMGARHPGTPILALSSSFFAGVENHGLVARSLGVAGVLAKPLTCNALIAGVQRALHRRA